MSSDQCPFKVGDKVVYRPTDRGRGTAIMTDSAALKPGMSYKIVRIVNGIYIVVEGFEQSVTGGVYWTEFAVE